MKFLFASVVSGLFWALVAHFIGREFLAGSSWLPALAGVLTGVLISFLSLPLYRRLSARHLLWWSPLSLYLAIAVFACILFTLRISILGPKETGKSWSPGTGWVTHKESWPAMVEDVIAMWYGVTVMPWFIVLIPLSWSNHRVMKSIQSNQIK